MARPSTALTTYAIPGRARGPVRVHRPGRNKSSFRVVWTDDDGRQRERTFKSEQLAQTAAATLAHDLATSVSIQGRPAATFGHLLDHYLYGPGMSKKWRSEKSARRPRQLARRYLIPQDLEVTATDLAGPEGAAFCHLILDRVQQLGTRIGTQEYEKAGALLATVLDTAVRDGLIELPMGNPMRSIPHRMGQFSGRSDRRAANVVYVTEDLRPSTDRLTEFVHHTDRLFGELEATYVRVLAFGGLRPGEANALTPRQVLTGNHDGLQIDQQLLELTATEAAEVDGATQQFRLPKWGRIRDAWIPPELRADLLRLASERSLAPDDVFFPAPSGSLRWQGNWRRNVFNIVATEADWPSHKVFIRNRTERHWSWPVYAFRHHYANYLLKECEVPIYLVSDYMGHRHTWITEHMYAKPQRADLDFATSAHQRRWLRDMR